jgi:hypothetical protein
MEKIPMRFPHLTAAWAFTVVLLSACAGALAQDSYYVRPGGTGRGLSAKDAFGTVEQTRDAIRARSDASITGDVTVHLLPQNRR